MSKVKIEIDSEQAKIDALKVYLPKKKTSLEAEIERHIDTLFNKNVPTAVKEFIQESTEPKTSERRPETATFP